MGWNGWIPTLQNTRKVIPVKRWLTYNIATGRRFGIGTALSISNKCSCDVKLLTYCGTILFYQKFCDFLLDYIKNLSCYFQNFSNYWIFIPFETILSLCILFPMVGTLSIFNFILLIKLIVPWYTIYFISNKWALLVILNLPYDATLIHAIMTYLTDNTTLTPWNLSHFWDFFVFK